MNTHAQVLESLLFPAEKKTPKTNEKSIEKMRERVNKNSIWHRGNRLTEFVNQKRSNAHIFLSFYDIPTGKVIQLCSFLSLCGGVLSIETIG